MTKENWEEMLHVSGVAEIRAQYWHQYNYEKYKHSSSPVQSDAGGEAQDERGGRESMTLSEELIIPFIPDEVVSVLQTATLLQVELGIDVEEVFKLFPRPITLGNPNPTGHVDTSLDSKVLLCPAHMQRLAAVVERLGDKAPMRTILLGKPAAPTDDTAQQP